MYLSQKPVKSLSECVGERLFLIPKSKANEIDIVTGAPCLFIGINGKATYLPVDIPTPVSYEVFCVLRDVGILSYKDTYESGEEIKSL